MSVSCGTAGLPADAGLGATVPAASWGLSSSESSEEESSESSESSEEEESCTTTV